MLQILVALMGLSIMALLAGPTVKLALMPVYTQKQKNNYTLAEAKAILIRKQVVNDDATFYDATDSTSKITQANVASSLTSSGLSTVLSGCTINENDKDGNPIPYNPPQSSAYIPKAVECTVGSGQFKAIAWQPLYTSTNLSENALAYTKSQLTADNMVAAIGLCAAAIVATPPTTTTISLCGGTFTNNFKKDNDFSNVTIVISKNGSTTYDINFKK